MCAQGPNNTASPDEIIGAPRWQDKAGSV